MCSSEHRRSMTLAVILAASALAAATARGDEQPPATSASLPAAGTVHRVSRKRPKTQPETAASWHARHGLFFQRNWGVDILGVRRVSSGIMLRFDYRVVDVQRAQALRDKKQRPYLIDEATGTALAVPAMENVGELRQVAPYEADRTYFIIFGNPGGLVKRGGRVSLVIGNLRAEGLVVN